MPNNDAFVAQSPIMSLKDIVRRVQQNTLSFGENGSRVVGVTRLHNALTIGPGIPYIAIFHIRDAHEYNRFASEHTTRVNADWAMIMAVDPSDDRQPSTDTASRGLTLSEEAECSVRQWIPAGRRYRPTQILDARWLNGFSKQGSSNREYRQITFRMSYLLDASERCPTPPGVCISDIDLEIVNPEDTTKGVLPEPTPKEFSVVSTNRKEIR